MKKRIFLAVVFLAAVVLLTACGSKGLEGTWKMTKVESVNGDSTILEELKGVEMEMKFNNGNVKIIRNGQTSESDYKENGSKLEFSDGSSVEFKLDGNILTITQGNARFIYSRK